MLRQIKEINMLNGLTKEGIGWNYGNNINGKYP
jgi:hypothetical protein